jgi:hypothetical protein
LVCSSEGALPKRNKKHDEDFSLWLEIGEMVEHKVNVRGFRGFRGYQVSMLFALAALVNACSGQDAPEAAAPLNALTAAEEAAGWQLLFDGETTSGWRGYNQDSFPAKGWAVSDGTLMTVPTEPADRGLRGDILTEEQFENFELSIEFKVSPGGNSGILYRVVEREGEPIWYNAPEYQVLDDSAHLARPDLDMRKHLTGDNYDLHASAMPASNQVGDWNHARIIIDNGHVEHWLNGQKTVEYEIESPEWEELYKASKFSEYPSYGRTAAGHIGLQDYGDNVWYRNIKIRQR